MPDPAGAADLAPAARAHLEAGQLVHALAALARARDRRGRVAHLEAALEAHRAALTGGDPDRARALRRVLGDARTLVLSLERAAEHFDAAGDGEALARLHRLAVDLGRPRAVAAIEARLPPGRRLGPGARRAFLRERALPQVPIGGDVEAGFWIDEAAADAICRELGEPPRLALARTARLMRARGSRHIAKLYVLARLAGDDALAAELQPEFDARAAAPRTELADRLAAALGALGGRLVGVLQEGDADGYNPKSAHVFAAELDGVPVVVKEHLRLPIDPARIDGTSQERELLEAIDDPRVVRLRRVIELAPHELLVLDRAPGENLAERTRPGALLPTAQAVALAGALADLLAALHARSILYLDVKARNLLVEPGPRDGARAPRFTLVDLGMAQRLPAGRAEATSLLSTAAYVPPEMGRSLRATAASDVFQLGLLACELLTGRHPFAAIDFAEGDDERESELVRYALPNLSARPDLDALGAAAPAIAPLVRRMLDADPRRRPPLAEVRAALARAR